MIRAILIALVIVAAIAGGKYAIYEVHLAQMRARYPYKAYFNGQVLTDEGGQSPLRFSTEEGAQHYAEDYAKP